MLISHPPSPRIYMGTLSGSTHRRRFRSSFYAFRLKHTLIFTRGTRMTSTKPKKRTTRTTPPMPTRNMGPRREPPRRGNSLPSPKVLSATVSFECTRLTNLQPQSLRVHLVPQQNPTPTQIMAPDPRRRRKLVQEMKLGCPPEA